MKDEKEISPFPIKVSGNLRERLETQYDVIFDKKIWETRDPDNIISQRIKEMLDIYGLNQTEFSEKLGLTSSYVSSVLNGRKNISEPFVKKVCNKTGISWSWILKGEGDVVKNNAFTILQHLSNITGDMQPEDAAFFEYIFSFPYEIRKIFYSFFKIT